MRLPDSCSLFEKVIQMGDFYDVFETALVNVISEDLRDQNLLIVQKAVAETKILKSEKVAEVAVKNNVGVPIEILITQEKKGVKKFYWKLRIAIFPIKLGKPGVFTYQKEHNSIWYDFNWDDSFPYEEFCDDVEDDKTVVLNAIAKHIQSLLKQVGANKDLPKFNFKKQVLGPHY